ncbi:hypothetical protein [Candidatus Lucifugimonas marina]|uniref:Uncharacterized protein n=1 Tax=Candidatus Lucifugimonas marina TaxID=3038979 RepID=A0AAJ5ZJ35_9CHLR|nr:hypothetical protein [SAR202 cluster bacterium JH702]MDG0868473.1 hypothetical protein [SAR202 cluster bacterium JH639]WFG35106.1 hypothetical protein GKN94_05170 [SAR202 cluster bacterium JH545]WFG39063.1 hypothetical protein GKO48_05335 [SAR202 cluster bacterium JH1073]
MVSSQESSTTVESLAREARAVISRLKTDLEPIEIGGERWKLTILETIAKWPLASEKHAGEVLVYLIGGEAFDWRLLAQRLLEECGSSIEEDKWREWLSDPVLFAGFEEPEFMRAVGVDKGRAHLSYFYGVTVEQALIGAVEEEVTHRRVAAGRQLSDQSLETAYETLYGNTRDQLWEVFKLEVGITAPRDGWRHRDEHTLGSEDAFTYWLFKLRMERSDPAKIASDTRKGLAKLERMRQNDVRRKNMIHSDMLQKKMRVGRKSRRTKQ